MHHRERGQLCRQRQADFDCREQGPRASPWDLAGELTLSARCDDTVRDKCIPGPWPLRTFLKAVGMDPPGIPIRFYYLSLLFMKTFLISVVSAGGWWVDLLADQCSGIIMSFPLGDDLSL